MEGAGASLTSLTLKAGDMAHCNGCGSHPVINGRDQDKKETDFIQAIRCPVTMNLYMVGLRGQRLKFAVPGNPVQVSSSAMGVAPARRITRKILW